MEKVCPHCRKKVVQSHRCLATGRTIYNDDSSINWLPLYMAVAWNDSSAAPSSPDYGSSFSGGGGSYGGGGASGSWDSGSSSSDSGSSSSGGGDSGGSSGGGGD